MIRQLSQSRNTQHISDVMTRMPQSSKSKLSINYSPLTNLNLTITSYSESN